jgi:hypothetical protein
MQQTPTPHENKTHRKAAWDAKEAGYVEQLAEDIRSLLLNFERYAAKFNRDMKKP